MTSLSKLAKVFTVIVAICVFQVYVIGSVSKPSTEEAGTTLSGSSVSTLVLGRLAIPDDQFALVNGNTAYAGTTIFSGSQLQTADVEAEIQVGTASLYLA